MSWSKVALVSLVALALAVEAMACPFCSPPGPTLSEEIDEAAAVVIAKLIGKAPAPSPDDPQLDRFEIVQVLKGQAALGTTRHVDHLLVGEHTVGQRFLIVANDDDGLAWTQPLLASARAEAYLLKLPQLAPRGVERLAFFLPYLGDSEQWLRDDAYSEFAKAPYDEVKALAPQLDRELLVTQIKRRELDVSLRRLYLTLLGICGTDAELPLLETWIRTRERELKPSLDAIVACYLTLRGAEGLPLIEQELLSRPGTEFIDVYATVQALRFHGEEERRIERPRLAQSLRLLLNQPQTAEPVIADLARWQDWSAIEPLVTLFPQVSDKQRSIRVLIVQYLHACPLPAAKTQLEQLKQIDAEAVRHGLSPLAIARKPKEREPRE